jgi:uncharacterized protein
MVNFKPLALEDKELFLEYLKDYDFNTYEYSFSTLYLWRKLCNVEYAIIKDAIIVRKTEKSFGTYFMQPIGYKKENLKYIIDILMGIKKEDKNIKCLFRDIEKTFLDDLKELFPNDVCFCEDINNFDYIYKREELMTLKGNRFHKKRNHYNQFLNSYEYVVKDFDEEKVLDDCREFAVAWNENKEEMSRQLEYELEGIKDLLQNYKALDLQGMAVYVNDGIIGFTIGEKVNNKMAIIHIEKANADFRGIYNFINKTFIERYYSDLEFINREEDLGVEGLREAKSSYHPVKLEKKYIASMGCTDELLLTYA